MPATYPVDLTTYMDQEGPTDRQFRIMGGALLYHPKCDGRFPYLYRIQMHALVHSPDHFRTILIHVVDTSVEARIRRAQFENLLSVPLGPNALMKNYGTLSESDICLSHFLTMPFRLIGTRTRHNCVR
jgi:hypothetical protein